MALVVGTNSYLNAADADAYFSDRLYTDAWDNATDPNKAAALVMATKTIERQLYTGKPATTDQALNFPRALPPDIAFRLNVPSGLYANPLTAYDGPLQMNRTWGYGYPQQWVVQATVPQAVLDAVCEEALARLAESTEDRDRRDLQRQGVVSVRNGDFAESYTTDRTGRSVKPNSLRSQEAVELLKPFMAGAVRIR